MCWLSAVVMSLVVAGAQAESPERRTATTEVVLETSKGDITFELLTDKAPLSTANFIEYVKAGFYDGTIFHRVIPDFVVQGGGLTPDMQRKKTRPPITNEADNGLTNERGTVALARTRDPHSATSQFFVNLKNNRFLNHRSKTLSGWGYTVFARVSSGMDVVDRMAASPTGSGSGTPDVPLEPITINAARVQEPRE
jgi:peptidyl-prolyl cis-trans isomerase B (cyclophilin B)